MSVRNTAHSSMTGCQPLFRRDNREISVTRTMPTSPRPIAATKRWKPRRCWLLAPDMEEGEVGRQLLLRDAPVRAEPGAQQRPEAFRRVDVDLAEPVAVLVARVLAAGVADRLVPVAPVVQAPVDVVLVGVHQGALGDGRLDDRPD